MSFFEEYIKNITDTEEILTHVEKLSKTTDTEKDLLTTEEQLKYIESMTEDLLTKKEYKVKEELKTNIKLIFNHLKEDLKDEENKKKIKESLKNIYKKIEENIKKAKEEKKEDFDYFENVEWLKELENSISEGAISASLKFLDDTIYKQILTSISNLDIQEKHIKFLKEKLKKFSKIEKIKEEYEKAPNIKKISLEKDIEKIKEEVIQNFEKEIKEIKKELEKLLSSNDINQEEKNIVEKLLEQNKDLEEKLLQEDLQDKEKRFNFIKFHTKLDTKRIMFDLKKIESTKKIFKPIIGVENAKTIIVDQDYTPMLELISSLSIDLFIKKKFNIDSNLTFLVENIFEKNIDIKNRLTNLYTELKTTSGNLDKDFAVLLLIDDLKVSGIHKNIDLESGEKIKDFFQKTFKSLKNLFNPEKPREIEKLKDLYAESKDGMKIIKEIRNIIKHNKEFKTVLERNNYIEQMIKMLKKYGYKDDILEYREEIRKRSRIKQPIYTEILKINTKINRINNNFYNEFIENELLFNSRTSFIEYLERENISIELKKDIKTNEITVNIRETRNQNQYDKEEQEILLKEFIKKEDEKIKIHLDKNKKIKSFITESQAVTYISDLKSKIEDLKKELIYLISKEENSININQTSLIKEIDEDLEGLIKGEGIKDLKIFEELNKFHPKLKGKLTKYIEKAKDITQKSTSEENLKLEIERRKYKRKKPEDITKKEENSLRRNLGKNSEIYRNLEEEFNKEVSPEKMLKAFKDEEYEELYLIKNNYQEGITKYMKSTKSTRKETSKFQELKNWFNQLKKDSYHRYFNKNNDLIKPEKINIRHIYEAREEFENILGYFYKSETGFEEIENGEQLNYNEWRENLENTFKMLKSNETLSKKMLEINNKNQFLSKIINEVSNYTHKGAPTLRIGINNKKSFEYFHEKIIMLEEELQKRVFSKEKFDKEEVKKIIKMYFKNTIDNLGYEAKIFQIDKKNGYQYEDISEDKYKIEKWLEDFTEEEFKRRKTQSKNEYEKIYIKNLTKSINEVKESLELKLEVLIDDIDFLTHYKYERNLEKDHLEKTKKINQKFKEFNYIKNIYLELKDFYKVFSDNYSNEKLEFKDKYGYLNRELKTFEKEYKKTEKKVEKTDKEKLFFRTWRQQRNQRSLKEIQNSYNKKEGFTTFETTFADFSNKEEAYSFTRKAGRENILFDKYRSQMSKVNPETLEINLSFLKNIINNQSENQEEIILNNYLQENFLSYIFSSNMIISSHFDNYLEKRLIRDLENYNNIVFEEYKVSEKFLKHYILKVKKEIKKLMEEKRKQGIQKDYFFEEKMNGIKETRDGILTESGEKITLKFTKKSMIYKKM